jgi:hypothetical protein
VTERSEISVPPERLERTLSLADNGMILIGGRPYPLPTNGILVAMTVMNNTLASSGRPAI